MAKTNHHRWFSFDLQATCQHSHWQRAAWATSRMAVWMVMTRLPTTLKRGFPLFPSQTPRKTLRSSISGKQMFKWIKLIKPICSTSNFPILIGSIRLFSPQKPLLNLHIWQGLWLQRFHFDDLTQTTRLGEFVRQTTQICLENGELQFRKLWCQITL